MYETMTGRVRLLCRQYFGQLGDDHVWSVQLARVKVRGCFLTAMQRPLSRQIAPLPQQCVMLDPDPHGVSLTDSEPSGK